MMMPTQDLLREASMGKDLEDISIV